jgi:hypothetical protein
LLLPLIAAVVAAGPLPAPPAPPPISAIRRADPAQTPAAPADPATLAAARELVEVQGGRERFAESARRASEMFFDATMVNVEREYGTLPADLKLAVRRVVTDENEKLITTMQATVIDDVARVYARYFTADELREFKRLQANPVLAKMQAVAPKMMPELLQIGLNAAAKRQPEISARIRAVVSEWYRSHKKERPKTT